MLPLADVILVAYYGDKWLPKCLETLALEGSQVNLILVDNAGNNNIDQYDFSAFSGYQILPTPRPMGFAEANNYALVNGHLKGDYILFLNQDTISPPKWLSNCLNILDQYPNIGALCPLIRNYDNSKWDPSFLDCLSEEQRESLSSKEGEPLIFSDVAPAPSLFVRTSVLKSVGPFDPVFGSYYEDYDLCRRIKEAGYEIAFYRRAFIQHFSGSATTDRAKELKRMRQVIRNRAIYEARGTQKNRILYTAKLFFWKLPYRFLRGLLKTPSSQPSTIVLHAFFDLLKLSRRLTSKSYDQWIWFNYLESIYWKNQKRNS